MFGMPFILGLLDKIKRDKREAIVFCLYALWHCLIVDVIASSTESTFKLIVSAIGLIVVDLYLFFNHYNKTNK